MSNYNYPVWGTQGGGLVRDVGGKLIFVTKPNCPGLEVGDEMPAEWGIAPANDMALDERDTERDLQNGFDEFFEIAFAMRDRGEINTATIGEFFPEIVKAQAQHARQ